MPVRRAADPTYVQGIWNAIRLANIQKQVPEVSIILKFLQKDGACTQSLAELYINQMLQDGLIMPLTIFDDNGSKITVGNTYTIPSEDLTTPEDDGLDWYCIECHLGGDVTPCRLCYRVFHPECSKKASRRHIIFQSVKSSHSSSNKQNEQSTHNKSLNETDKNTDISNDDFSNRPSMVDPVNKLDKIENQLSNLETTINNNWKHIGTKLSNNKNTNSKHDSDTKKKRNDNEYDVSLCYICNLSQVNDNCELEKSELNHLLGFILDRIRSWLPRNLTHTMSPEQQYEWLTEQELNWRAKILFYKHMDMSTMESKLQSKAYIHLFEFLADVSTVQHNVSIFHGTESQEYGAADLMMRDCIYDLSELIVCPDCYRHSNEKANTKWFCFPCRNPHQLVWAKQKGYPYWPAKIIKETETNYDVRFFGGKYERSVLPKAFVKPIETKIQSLQVKRTSSFNKALEELRFHQHLLKNPNEVKKLLPLPKDTSQLLKSKKTNVSNDADQKKKSSLKKLDSTQDLCQVAASINQNENNEIPSQKTPKRRNILHRNKRKSESDMLHCSVDRDNFDVIPISDGEDDCEVSITDESYGVMKSSDSGFEQVSSSTEYITSTDDGFNSRDNIDNVMHELEQPYSDSVEKMRRKLEQAKDKNHLIKISMDCMQAEIDRVTNDHNEHLKKLFEAHNSQISETKKKQWCYNCEQDAIYHCCWNTAYCSPTCQQQHWQAEHKKVCRRKR